MLGLNGEYSHTLTRVVFEPAPGYLSQHKHNLFFSLSLSLLPSCLAAGVKGNVTLGARKNLITLCKTRSWWVWWMYSPTAKTGLSSLAQTLRKMWKLPATTGGRKPCCLAWTLLMSPVIKHRCTDVLNTLKPDFVWAQIYKQVDPDYCQILPVNIRSRSKPVMHVCPYLHIPGVGPNFNVTVWWSWDFFFFTNLCYWSIHMWVLFFFTNLKPISGVENASPSLTMQC